MFYALAVLAGVLAGYLIAFLSNRSQNAQFERLAAESVQLRQNAVRAEAELAAARQSLLERDRQLQQAAQFAEQQRAEAVRQQAELTRVSSQAAALEADRDALRRELAELGNAQQRQLQQLDASLRAQIDLRQQQLAKLEADSRSHATDQASAQAALRAELDARLEDLAQLRAENSRLAAALKAERDSVAEKVQIVEKAREQLAHQFEALAADVLDKKSKSFADSSQKELGTLLDPLRSQLSEFREKVERAQADSSTGVTKLETLIGTLGNLNQQLTDEARNLATALRGSSKAQGDWGEFILRDLLEKAGLREGEQYSFQQSFTGVETAEGKPATQRTDVIVKMPGERHLIIDSKVSLGDYTDSVNASTDEARSAALKAHLGSVRKHVLDLAERRYDKLPGVESPDFVVMFIPVEPAYLAALREDESLWRAAYEKNVLLVGPTTLLFVIRIVDNLWQQEQQARNVQQVMERGTALYDKFVGFVADLEKVGASLRTVDQSYQNAMKKLTSGSGNLVRQVEMLRTLGVRSAKTLSRQLLEDSGAASDAPLLELAAETAEE